MINYSICGVINDYDQNILHLFAIKGPAYDGDTIKSILNYCRFITNTNTIVFKLDKDGLTPISKFILTLPSSYDVHVCPVLELAYKIEVIKFFFHYV